MYLLQKNYHCRCQVLPSSATHGSVHQTQQAEAGLRTVTLHTRPFKKIKWGSLNCSVDKTSMNQLKVSSSLTDDVDVDVSHVEPGQVADSEDARVRHLHFLDDELGPLHGDPALQLGVQRRRQDALLHNDPAGAIRLGFVENVQARVVQVQFQSEVVATGRVQEVLVLCGRKRC